MIVIFGIFTTTLFLIHYPAGTFAVGSFKASPFFGQFGVAAGLVSVTALNMYGGSRGLRNSTLPRADPPLGPYLGMVRQQIRYPA